MAPLTKLDLAEIDKRIDSSIASQRLLSLPRDIAVIHMLRYFEDYIRLYSLKVAENKGSEAYEAVLKNGQDGMHFAIWWIFKHCPSNMQKPQVSTQENAYIQARELHEAAMDYSMVWDFMALLQRERATGQKDSDGTIHLQYAEQLIADIEVADRFIGAPDNPELRKNIIPLDMDPRQFVADIQFQPYGPGKVRYHIPNSTFERIVVRQRQLLSHLWEIDPSWDLGGYTVSQFREFWTTLITLCWIHHWICFSSGIEGGALNSVVRVLKRRRWEKELVRWSGLNKDVVSIILDDLIYDPTLYGLGKKQPDVTYQPFFPLGSDLLALSNWLVLLSNAERNIWGLVSIKREKIHAELRNRKEKLWLLELSPRLESYGLSVYGPVSFTYGGRKSDLDMLVLDDKAYFGVGFQLKWLTSPDRIRDVKYTEDELQKGLDQAALSLQWLNSTPRELKQLTGFSTDELAKYEFKTMVLSKNTIGSGWVHKPQIPIINERLAHWISGSPHQRSLQTLWQVGEERRYLPKRDKHFKDEDVVVEFGGVRFLGERLGMTLQAPWDPEEDIELTGLP